MSAPMNEPMSGLAKHENEGGNGDSISGRSRLCFALLIFFLVHALLIFFVSSIGQNVMSSVSSKRVIDAIAASKSKATCYFVGAEASVDATSKLSPMAVALQRESYDEEEDTSFGARRILGEEPHEESFRKSVQHGDNVTVRLENTDMQQSVLVDSPIFGKFSTWKKENEYKNLDSTIRLMRDQIIMARIYMSISKKKKKLDLYQELQSRLKKSHHALGEANVDAELHHSAPARIRAMAEILMKARDQLFDCELVTRKLRAMILTEEEKVRRLQRQNTFLAQLGVKSIPGGLRCLSLRLTIEYYLLPPEERIFPKSENLENPDLYHYALFSDNVVAASVVVNSTVVNSKDSSKHVFHLVTDNLNFGAMKMWFLLNTPKEATIHVENLDDFKWLNSSYCPVLRQLKSAVMKDYYFKTKHSTTHSSTVSDLKYRNPKYLSMLNHLRFYLPQIFPKLDKILFLDDDVVVQKDLTELWVVNLEGKVNGAVETCVQDFHRLHTYLNFSNSYIAREFDPNACGWAYGMNIFDLKEWKRKNVTDIYHKWQNLNEDRLLWKLGSLSAGLMTFYGLTYPLEKSWHVLGLGYNSSMNQTEIENAAVIHYNGNMKPWLEMAITKYRPHWTKYIDYDHPYIRQCNFIK